MKKKILISVGVIIVLTIIIFVYAFIISFKVVKQTTDNINLALKEKFQSIVRIPESIPPSLKSFEITNYTWEMETREKEVTTVIFTHETGFDRNKEKLLAFIEMSQGDDPSLFNKVLPAVVSDSQALEATQNLEDANLGSNNEIGYNRLESFQRSENSSQITKIVWEFDHDKIVSDSEELYDKIFKYPHSILKTLYFIQRSALILLAP